MVMEVPPAMGPTIGTTESMTGAAQEKDGGKAGEARANEKEDLIEKQGGLWGVNKAEREKHCSPAYDSCTRRRQL